MNERKGGLQSVASPSLEAAARPGSSSNKYRPSYHAVEIVNCEFLDLNDRIINYWGVAPWNFCNVHYEDKEE